MLHQSIAFNVLIVACALVVLILLFRPRVVASTPWRATITPLASIIGSGFLVVAPLLHHIVNGYTTLAMLAIVLLAYGVGSVLRYNIRHVEPRISADRPHRVLFLNEQVAHLALALAYLISVAFYLRLMASFLLQLLDIKDDFAANVITTGFLLFILSAGLWRGLRGLEKLEEFAVHVKLAIIAALLFGLGVYDIDWLLHGGEGLMLEAPEDPWHTFRLLAGVLLIVQGFETSRYLGDEYSAQLRIKTMRRGQIIAGMIYIVFVSLALPTLIGFDRQPSETAIIDLSEKVALALPLMLILAAVMSQFSASVADTVGAGGLMEEASGQRIRSKTGYAVVCVVGIIMVWTADIFEIISLASRAFALYYAIQCLSAIFVTFDRREPRLRRDLHLAGFASLAVVLALISLFALPAGH